MNNHLDPIKEYWCPIDEFPDYDISSTGFIVNSDTNRIMKTSKTAQGALKVGLMGRDGKQHTRSVKVLVAEAFVDGKDELFNTPVNLDGDQENCVVENLVWRPRWFAYKYTIQFSAMYGYYEKRQIKDIGSGEVYHNIKDAAMRHGLLMKDILTSCHNHTLCFPTGQSFRFLDET